MKTATLRKAVAGVLVVDLLAVAAWAESAPNRPPEPFQGGPGQPVSCVVKITCDPALLPLSPESIRALLGSSFVAGEAYKQALRSSAFEMPYQVDFRPLPGGVAGPSTGRVPIISPLPAQSGGAFVPAPGGGGAGFGAVGGVGGYGGMVGGAGGYGGGAGGGGGGVGSTAREEPGVQPPNTPAGSVLGAGPGFRQPYPSVPIGAPLGVGGGGGGASGGAVAVPAGPGVPSAGAAVSSPGLPGTFNMPVSPPGAVFGPQGPGAGPMMLDVMMPEPQESSILGQIEVFIPDADFSVNEVFLRAVCEKLQQALASLHQQELSSLDRRMQMSADEQAQARARLERMQHQRRELLESGQSDLMPEAVMDQIRRLDFERQRMEMDLLGQQARLKALQQQIQATGERILRQSTDDAMIKPLQEKLELLREHLKHIAEQNKAGMTPESEVQKVRIAIAEAEAQLAEARRKVGQAGGGEILGKLNAELSMLSVTVAETEARLKHVREQMEKSRQLAGAADRYELEIAMAMPYVRRAYETSMLRFAELEQRMRTAVAPMVTVIGGATSKPAK